MKILALGHSAYLLEMSTSGSADPVRILADPWLSDHVVGDLLGRFPRLRFETPRLGPLQGIFLSHSHTDHFDPESLLSLWRELSPQPTVIIPESLEFLADLIRQFLDGVELLVLRERRPLDFHGVEISGFFNPETRPTNEDDAMILVVRNEREVFIGESDAVIPFYDPEAREAVSALVEAPETETACFLTIKNEGDATMAMLGAADAADRRERLTRSVERAYEGVEEIYSPPVDELDGDLWQNERLVRLVAGQGICFPQQLGTAWNRVLFPIRLEDRVRMEREVGEQFECKHSIEEMVPGLIHHLESGRLVRREECSFIEMLDREVERHFDAGVDLFDTFPAAPLRDEPRNTAAQRRRILERLNGSFLPHLIGARRPPVEHLLGKNGGEYRVRLRYGTTEDAVDEDYRITFRKLHFEPLDVRGDADEHYWANDVEDFLDGRCDEFSTFCRKPLAAPEQRFWNAMGLPFLNNDLIEKKLRLHFERAARGKSSSEWVLSFYPETGDASSGRSR